LLIESLNPVGRCIKKKNSSVNDSQSEKGQCELEGWCPVPDDHNIPTPSRDSLNFTIFIKNIIENPRFGVVRDNTMVLVSYLKRCNYDPHMDTTCPVFRIGTILDIVDPDRREQESLLQFGGVIHIKIHWNCNLDKPLDQCNPHYSFERLDYRYRSEAVSYGAFER
jgi:P2X purinoceptor 5